MCKNTMYMVYALSVIENVCFFSENMVLFVYVYFVEGRVVHTPVYSKQRKSVLPLDALWHSVAEDILLLGMIFFETRVFGKQILYLYDVVG